MDSGGRGWAHYVDGEVEEEEAFLRIDFFAKRLWLVESVDAVNPFGGFCFFDGRGAYYGEED